jgi:hypothetical protein
MLVMLCEILETYVLKCWILMFVSEHVGNVVRTCLIYGVILGDLVRVIALAPHRRYLSAFRPRGVPRPTSKLSSRAPAQMGRRETEREGGKTRGRQA